MNKTADYVDKLSETEIKLSVEEVRTGERKLRKSAKQRQSAIYEELVQRQEQKKRDIENTRL